jgi:type I restriction enzyme M protein
MRLLDSIAEMKLAHNNTIDVCRRIRIFNEFVRKQHGQERRRVFHTARGQRAFNKVALVGKTDVNKVYAPACGSVSPLLIFAKILCKDNSAMIFRARDKQNDI